uniref:Ribonuclease H-like domain-containing protein n=1 Tax=Tanacetum cinerariifolium TaxID=118510 RepID=A0A6L2JCH8_TANCI|nr:ribonuclease H-like domain-containing protein [Tanacetum cinerariifolium]
MVDGDKPPKNKEKGSSSEGGDDIDQYDPLFLRSNDTSSVPLINFKFKDGDLRELSVEEAWEAIENFAQGLFGNENVWVEMHRDIAWDKVENPNPQSTRQVLPSFGQYTPYVTHPEELKETIGIPIEVEPLHEPQLEDLGLNTYNHDIYLSFREAPSFNELKPQLQPLPNCPPLGVNLGDKRGTDPPIKLHSPDNFRIKVIFDEKKHRSS